MKGHAFVGGAQLQMPVAAHGLLPRSVANLPFPSIASCTFYSCSATRKGIESGKKNKFSSPFFLWFCLCCLFLLFLFSSFIPPRRKISCSSLLCLANDFFLCWRISPLRFDFAFVLSRRRYLHAQSLMTIPQIDGISKCEQR